MLRLAGVYSKKHCKILHQYLENTATKSGILFAKKSHKDGEILKGLCNILPRV